MPSPPPSSDFEFDPAGDDPADEIPLLVADARRTTTLTPALATVMTTHKPLILSVLDRQIQLIKSRSQALEDGHVTVYDKALLILTSNGTDIENPAALLFWCEYHLSIDTVRRPFETARLMQEMMAVPTVINQAMEASSLHRLSGTTLETERDNTPETVIFGRDATDPKIQRMFLVYDQACTEYSALSALPGEDTTKRITVAKFLRDSAENALSILKDKKVEASVLAELKETFDMAKGAVVTLSGGRKRKFDAPAAMELKKDGGRGGRGGRGGAGRTRGGRGRGGGGGGGRGHSGIAYGYTRAVDSYAPY